MRGDRDDIEQVTIAKPRCINCADLGSARNRRRSPKDNSQTRSAIDSSALITALGLQIVIALQDSLHIIISCLLQASAAARSDSDRG